METHQEMLLKLKFIQDVKQEAFKVSWPTGKETLTGATMVVLLAIIASLFIVTSILLTIISKEKFSGSSVLETIEEKNDSTEPEIPKSE